MHVYARLADLVDMKKVQGKKRSLTVLILWWVIGPIARPTH